MLDPQSITRFNRWLFEAESVLLIAHEHPDGDTLSAALAMRQILSRFDKKTTVVCKDAVPPAFEFLPESKSFQTDFFGGDYDLVMVLDCGDLRRTGFADRLKFYAAEKRRLVNLDHHPKNDLNRIANLNLVDFKTASTTQVIYQLASELKWVINADLATTLLCGLYTDTGGFKHPNTNQDVLNIAADLLARGGRLQEIIHHLTNVRSISMLRLWGLALERIQWHPEFQIVSSMIMLDDLGRCRADQDDIAGVVNLMKTIPGAKAVLLFIEQPDGSIKASLRTDAEGVDVSRLAAFFGGGGLRKAGGFTIPGRMIWSGNQWNIMWTYKQKQSIMH